MSKRASCPKLTIVTVTYNAEEYLERTIQSVVEQDYPNIEYIIIDGKSTDKTVDIIKKYEKNITYWISEPDKGLYHAMNKGIDKASGKWINFMNAGDTFFNKTVVSDISKYFIKENQIICGDIMRGENFQTYYKPRGLDDAYNAVFVNHQASFVKTKIMRKYHFDDNMKISSDYGFFFRCFVKGKRFKYLDMPMVKSLEGGISQNNNVKAWTEALYLQAKYLKNPLEVFNSRFYQHLSRYPDNNKLFLQLLIKFIDDLKVKLQNKKFILYGFGTVGQLLYTLYKEDILYIVDKKFEEIRNTHDLNIRGLESLRGCSENILIAALGHESSVKQMLKNEYKIEENRIIEVQILR